LTTIRLRGIAAPCQDTDIRKVLSCLFENLSQFIEWTEQVTLNVVVESLQWRDIEDACSSRRPLPCDQLIEAPEEGGKGLPAAGGRRDKKMFSCGNLGPGLLLQIGRLAHSPAKPFGHQRMK
jgi:hypothetical protein